MTPPDPQAAFEMWWESPDRLPSPTPSSDELAQQAWLTAWSQAQAEVTRLRSALEICRFHLTNCCDSPGFSDGETALKAVDAVLSARPEAKE